MFVNSVPVRAAAALGSANTTTSGINIRGASFVAFEVTATDAGTLSACTIQTSIDGTNWVSASSSLPSNGRGSMLAENTAAVGVVLNTGGAIVGGYPAGPSATLPYSPDSFARLILSPTTTVAGCAVTAHVFYESRPEPVIGGAFGIAK